jgi:hypothetical protein
MVSSSSSATSLFSRRDFISRTSQWSAALAACKFLPLPALSKSLTADSRIAQTPVVDKGFASVRKVGDRLYATISDTSKGLQTMQWWILDRQKRLIACGRLRHPCCS